METNLQTLISADRFVKETGIARHEFYRYADEGRIDGLLIIDDFYFVDRTQVNIRYCHNGYKFGLWKMIGGREAPVNVPEYIKVKNTEAKNKLPNG